MSRKNKKLKIENSDIVKKSDEKNVIRESTVVVSSFFTNQDDTDERIEVSQPPIDQSVNDLCEAFLTCAKNLNNKLSQLRFSKPIDFVYNPTEYAYDMFRNYMQTYCSNYKTIMYLGMNPGPWGMSQTGVPFGEISAVRDWLKLSGHIAKPERESPLRPVLGFECKRTEVSGKRFWGFIKDLCGSPEVFFKSSFVYNYCPLQLFTTSGKNITPAELKKNERDAMYEACDAPFLETVNIYKISIIVCIGKFCETRVNKIFKEAGISHIKVLTIPHPSPRAVGNNNWTVDTLKLMEKLELLPFYKNN